MTKKLKKTAKKHSSNLVICLALSVLVIVLCFVFKACTLLPPRVME